MVVFPNAKINIGLNIIGKRPDGFHNIETIFFPIQLRDALEILPAENNTDNLVEFTSSGLPINVATQDNICVKTYTLLKEHYPNLPNIAMHLHKHIPMGAGMGGGSANAAFVISAVNKLFNLQISQQQQINFASQLGSDCAFFIVNKPCFATGRGENLSEIAIDLTGYSICIVNPGIHVNTAQAFGILQVEDRLPEGQLIDAIKKPIEDWKNEVINGFEKSVFAQHPILAEIKQALYNQGAIYASMSGTGSTMYGIFPNNTTPSFNFHANFFCSKV
jgi:4-diphosphocytidyl-2-C-methyl-D-erythritol kinase